MRRFGAGAIFASSCKNLWQTQNVAKPEQLNLFSVVKLIMLC